MYANCEFGDRTYEAAASYLEKGRNKEDRPLPGRSTRLMRMTDHQIAVVYHDTAVVTYHEDGAVVLDSGGWRTVTTKERMNSYMPATYNLYQDRGVWYITVGPWWVEDPETGQYGRNPARYVYEDGVTLYPDGGISGAAPVAEAQRLEKLAKQINRFSARFAKALLEGKIPAPGAGDCFYCAMRIVGEDQTLGEASSDDHLLLHLEQSYFVPSLLLRAIEKRQGHIGPLILHYLSLWASGADDPFGDCGWLEEIVREQARKALRHYLRSQLGLTR